MRRARRPIVVAALAVALALLAAGPLPAQSLRGSRESVERMYRRAKAQGLHFYRTATGVRSAAKRGRFVRLRGNDDYAVASFVAFPWVTPETHLFVRRLAAQYRSYCGQRLVVTSAIRPSSRQPANSVARSVHPTGMAIDLRKPRDRDCLQWLRRTLLVLEARGVIEAIEEHRPPHFHVAVFPDRYERYVERRTGGTAAAAK